MSKTVKKIISIDKQELQTLVNQWKKNKSKDTLNILIKKCFYPLTEQAFGNYVKNISVHDYEDAVQQGILRCVESMERYNCKKISALKYFQLVLRNFYHVDIRKHYEYQ